MDLFGGDEGRAVESFPLEKLPMVRGKEGHGFLTFPHDIDAGHPTQKPCSDARQSIKRVE
jgi:hypothetical protein